LRRLCQQVSARDLAVLAIHLIREYPELYSYFGEAQFTWNDVVQRNRNPLLGRYYGADGLKTGYTSESKYGLAASAVRNGHRLVLIINGAEDAATRYFEARKLLDAGFHALGRRDRRAF
jgi:D-alanyl-D-alanine carboxypeptidase (penicillin-binding protein 5/6)